MAISDPKRFGLVLPEFPFCKIAVEDTAIVHNEGKTHLALHLAQNVSDDGIGEKLAELVLNRGNGLALEARIVPCIFRLPKRTNERVFALPDYPGSIFLVSEQAIDGQKARILALKQDGNRVKKNVFKPRSPGIAPDTLERANDSRGDQVPSFIWNLSQKIKAHWKFEVTRVEIYQVVRLISRDVIENFLGQIAVRVDESHALSPKDVLDD